MHEHPFRNAVAAVAAATSLFDFSCTIPLSERPVKGTRTISSDAMQNMQIGKTSRVEVLSLMGKPDWTGFDDRAISYSSEVIVGTRPLVYGFSIPVRKPRRLCLVFDGNGVLVHKDFFQPGISESSEAPPCSPDAKAGAIKSE